ncbi:Crp/Fnr family transcriptional regulator [Cyanobium sp. Candia 9D4]|nr:Crp/Fnr family transcriptional regulator [Cyanobium sp. Candia 9D4]
MTPQSSGALTTMRLLAQGRDLRTVAPGEVIFQAGDLGNSVVGILEGEVRIDWAGGRESERLGPGSTFGVGALVDAPHLRFGTATAQLDTQLLEMKREEFLFPLQELPMLALEMLHGLEERLGDLKRAGGELSGPPPA